MKDDNERMGKVGPSTLYRMENSMWKEIKKLEVSNKVKNFMWRICRNVVATNSNLY